MRKSLENVKIIHRIIPAVISVITLIMACSWGGSIPVRQYYIINYTPAVTVSASSRRPYPYALQIGRFEVQRIFNRQEIIYRFSPNRIQYYEIERWAVRPDYMIKDVIFKHLEASNLVNRTSLEFLDTRPDFRIEGTVEAIEKYDAGDMFFAHLAMTFKMLRVESGEQIWNYSFDKRRQVYSKDMVHTVMGLSAILQTEMDIAVNQLDSLFYSLETGTPLKPVTEDIANEPARKDSTKFELDESAFEIIPEKRK